MNSILKTASMGRLSGILDILDDAVQKTAFVDPQTLQSGGMPPGGGGGMPMDPSMGGGMPPGGGGMPMDPSMMGGGGGMPMDPSMGGGMPPGGGGGGAMPMDPAMMQQMMTALGTGGEASGTAAVDPSTGAPIVAKKIDNSVLTFMLLRMMAHQMGIPQDLLTMPKQEAEQAQPASGGGGAPAAPASPAGAIAPVQPIEAAMPKQGSLEQTSNRAAATAYLFGRALNAQSDSR